MTLRSATLRSARMLSSDVREITLDPGEGFSWTPGQWVSLRLPAADGTLLARSYSIASCPRADQTFDLAITRVEGGPGSAWLHRAEVGDVIQMSGATGFFTLPEVIERPLLMVATGTGIAPMRAMLQRALAGEAGPRATLLFGVRTQEDVLYGDEFRALAERRFGFRFEPTLSRAGDAWSGRRGYVQTHLAELCADLGPCDVYVCGLNAMIRDVRKTLKEELAFTRERIHTERYD